MSAHVYIYWQDSTPLYVGVTVNVRRRVKEHLEKPWGKQATHITVRDHDETSVAYAEEVELIRHLEPLYNKRHNPRFDRFINAGRAMTPAERRAGDRAAAEAIDFILRNARLAAEAAAS